MKCQSETLGAPELPQECAWTIAAACEGCQVDKNGILWLLNRSHEARESTESPKSESVEESLMDGALAAEVQDLKCAFQDIQPELFRMAREAANPYEALDDPKCNPFLNRSALKLANLDSVLEHRLTQAVDRGEGGAQAGEDRLTFVDLCGGPGGFSEYFMRRCEAESRRATGWGMTLMGGECAWNLKRIGRWVTDRASKGAAGAAVPAAQELRLCHGVDGSGDLTVWANVESLADTVRRATHGQGVDVVVADGGFAEARGRFDQEHVMVPLVLSEVLAMSLLLRRGGTFVCKLFDVTLPATVRALALLAGAFDRMAIVKPVTSRPASSERYVVCVGRRDQCPPEALAPPWLPLKATVEEALRGSLSSGAHGAVDPVLTRFLRLTNDRALECQRDACYGILEEVERLEAEAQERRRAKKKRKVQHEEEGSAEEQAERGPDGAAAGGVRAEAAEEMRSRYRRAWRLDKLAGRSGEAPA